MNFFKNKKQSIFWDVDDVVIFTAKAAIEVINNRYNIPQNLPVKTLKDLKDWQMTSIYKNLSVDQLADIFESDEFWDIVEIDPLFLEIINDKEIMTKYNHVFVTKGTQVNLEKKRDYLINKIHLLFNEFEYIGLPQYVDKSIVNMENSIQIDDNIYNLENTSASMKFLIKNHNRTLYNNSFLEKDKAHEYYEIETLEEFKDILKFNLKHNLANI